MAESGKEKEKDKWDKADVILKPVGGLLTALAITFLGYIGSNALNTRQAEDSRFRLYSELTSKREETESALRKDMFKSIIDSFLNPNNGKRPLNLEEKVLNLELLVYNFHESLNLKPLFTDLQRQLEKDAGGEKVGYLDRLDKIAHEITNKQLLILESAGVQFKRNIDFTALNKFPDGVPLDEGSLTLDNVTRTFKILVMEADRKKKELKLRLVIITPRKTGDETNTSIFWIGFCDFPMIDNTRLSHDQRTAVVLKHFGKTNAEVALVYFPGAFASMKEKPYYQEVLQNLIKAKAITGNGSDSS